MTGSYSISGFILKANMHKAKHTKVDAKKQYLGFEYWVMKAAITAPIIPPIAMKGLPKDYKSAAPSLGNLRAYVTSKASIITLSKAKAIFYRQRQKVTYL